MEDWTTPKAYVRLTPVDKEIEVGDIVKLHHKDCSDTAMGKVVAYDGWYILLNNSEEFFSTVDWYCTILHSGKRVDTD